VTDPITYGLGVILSSPLIWIGLLLIGGGLLALAWMFRGPLGYYEPEIPAVVQPPVEATFIRPTRWVEPNYHRSGEYPVVARIPGATPEAGSADLETDQVNRATDQWVAQQDWDAAVDDSITGLGEFTLVGGPKERTEDTVALSSVATLAPQLANLARFLNAIDASTEELAVAADVTVELASDGNHTAAAEVDEAILRRVVDGLREPDPVPEVADDCPLTTQEIEIPTVGEAPVHAGIADREPTRDLSAAMEKVRQA
jgi:hypothetical protein